MMDRVEVIPRRLRTSVGVLTLIGDTVQPGALDLSGAPTSFLTVNQFAGIVGFQATSRWRLERFGAYLRPANLEHGWVQLQAGAEASELLPLSQGHPDVPLHWVMPPAWTGRLSVIPQAWNITPASQPSVTIWAQWVEEPSEAMAAARCAVDLG